MKPQKGGGVSPAVMDVTATETKEGQLRIRRLCSGRVEPGGQPRRKSPTCVYVVSLAAPGAKTGGAPPSLQVACPSSARTGTLSLSHSSTTKRSRTYQLLPSSLSLLHFSRLFSHPLQMIVFFCDHQLAIEETWINSSISPLHCVRERKKAPINAEMRA